MKYRFYSFVAHHYLSQLQCGLQTAHAIASLGAQVYACAPMGDSHNSIRNQYNQWAAEDQVIIICGAGNHAGVTNAFNTLRDASNNIPGLYLPIVMFMEDHDSMNGMATAAGIVVSDRYYDVECDSTGWLAINGPEFTLAEQEFVNILKSYRLA